MSKNTGAPKTRETSVDLEAAVARLGAYLTALLEAGHKLRIARAPHAKGSTVACQLSVDGFSVTAQYSAFSDRWITESRAVREIWHDVSPTGKGRTASAKPKDVARRRKMLKEDAQREAKARTLHQARVRRWNAMVTRASKELPKYVKALKSAGYQVKVFLDHKQGLGEKQMPKALQVAGQMVFIEYGPPWSAKHPEVEAFWRLLDGKKKLGSADLGGKKGPAVIFPPVRDAEMFNRFKVLCALLSGRRAVTGGGDDIATFTGLSGDAILGVLDELISLKAVRTRTPSKSTAKDTAGDLLGWLTQDEYELTRRGFAEVEKELHAWGKSKSFRPSLGATIEHRLAQARTPRRKPK